ncbi:glutathione S-transferase family protein [Xanthobacter sp. KR7-225]|uniref:glutathione S-transferase family protein n=1 Tax=Xanthobacter sp. KR7-225 TaxID=3156613 RepID=UPI0032B37E8B
MNRLTLISHHLCPYVQRAVIALAEKSVPYDRIDIDLANKPDWFLAISPLSKTPVLRVGGHAIFESAVILEYLEETEPHPLHPADPLARAQHRSWIEFGSSVLNDIAGLYNAPDAMSFEAKAVSISAKFAQIDARLTDRPYFAGARFSLVDAVFAPVFRYFDVFDRIGDFGMVANKPRLSAWRTAVAARPSVQNAAPADYPQRLLDFLLARPSYLASLGKTQGLDQGDGSSSQRSRT